MMTSRFFRTYRGLYPEYYQKILCFFHCCTYGNDFRFLMYNSPEEDVSINAVVKDETIWLSQKAMAELFDVEVPAISKHLSNIYEEGELQPDATVSKMEIVQKEGNRQVKRKVDFYNLDAIICQFPQSHPLPDLGNRCSEGVHDQRLCAGR